MNSVGAIVRRTGRRQHWTGAAGSARTRLVDGGDRFKCVRITDDDYVVLLDGAHPAAKQPALSAELLARIPHVVHLPRRALRCR
jgi:hypothetical protein